MKDKKRIVTKVQKLGVVKDKRDKRDFRYVSAYTPKELPKSYSIKQFVTQVKNQGVLSSCAAHAFANCYEIMKRQKFAHDYEISERYLYYKTRELEGTLPKNVGTQMRDNAKIFQKVGVAMELFCPYSEEDYNLEPNWMADFSAGFNRAKGYSFLYSLEEIKDAISQRIPVACSIQIFSNFYKFEEVLKIASGTLQGGHAMMIVGYDDETQTFEVLNQWGRSWQGDGFFKISYKYLQEYGLDRGYSQMILNL